MPKREDKPTSLHRILGEAMVRRTNTNGSRRPCRTSKPYHDALNVCEHEFDILLPGVKLLLNSPQ